MSGLWPGSYIRHGSHARFSTLRLWLVILLEIAMAVFARTLSRASGAAVDGEILKSIFIFCAVGLFVSLLSITCGLDLSSGPF